MADHLHRNTHFSVTPSKSCPDGTALPSNTARTRSGGDDRRRLIVPAANALRIRSKGSGETTHAPVAVGRNSRSAVLLPCALGRSARRLYSRRRPVARSSARGIAVFFLKTEAPEPINGMDVLP